MKHLTIPSRNETHPIDKAASTLQDMFDKNQGDDGLIFLSENNDGDGL